MRKTFLYPIINNLKQGHLSWLLEQSKKGLILKYLNKLLPKKFLVGPTMAILISTYRCNSHCIMCDLPLRSRVRRGEDGLPLNEFTTDQWKEVIQQLAEIKTAGIGFTGGEPLIRSDTPELLKYAKQKGMSVTLNTNAGLLTKEKIHQLLGSNIDNINISLDSAKAQTYDKIRGIPFIRIIENTKNLINKRNRQKAKTKVTVVICVSHYNVKELDQIADLAATLGADKLGFIPLHQIPNTPNYPKRPNNPNLTNLSNKTNRPLSCKDPYPNIGNIFLDKLEKIRKKGRIEIDNSTAYLNMFPLAFQGAEFPIPCLAGETSITIDCYGNVFACWPFLELNHPSLKLPNIPNTPLPLRSPEQSRGTKGGNNPNSLTLKSLWFSKDYEEIRLLTRNCRACFWNCHSELSIFYK